jgi:hypothetical protein
VEAGQAERNQYARKAEQDSGFGVESVTATFLSSQFSRGFFTQQAK